MIEAASGPRAVSLPPSLTQSGGPLRQIEVIWAGYVPFEDGLELQRKALGRLAQDGVETLLLLEHPHVFTLGRNASALDVLATPEKLREAGVTVHDTNRGGKVTYHGPGQLVGYPIMDLNPDRRDIGRFLRDLEEVMILTLAEYGVRGGRLPGLTGVWVGAEKLAAMGIHLSRWRTSHGFALNVSPDLSFFDLIVPCGLRDHGVTSMARLSGNAPPVHKVAMTLTDHFLARFGRVRMSWTGSGSALI